MAYYVLIEGNITNPTKYSKYREAVTPLVDQFGGRYLVRGGETQVFEGQHGECVPSTKTRHRFRHINR